MDKTNKALIKSSSYDQQPHGFQSRRGPAGTFYGAHAQNVPTKTGQDHTMAQRPKHQHQRLNHKYFNAHMKTQNPEDGPYQRPCAAGTRKPQTMATSQSYIAPVKPAGGNMHQASFVENDRGKKNQTLVHEPHEQETIGARTRRVANDQRSARLNGGASTQMHQSQWSVYHDQSSNAIPHHSKQQVAVVPLHRDTSKVDLSHARKRQKSTASSRHNSRRPSQRMQVDQEHERSQSQEPTPFGVNLHKNATAEPVAAPISLGSTQLQEYSKISVLGKGTYGEVHKCFHNPTRTVVAMKTFLFENVTNGINYSTMREISLLRQLSDHPQFVRLLDIIEEANSGSKMVHCIFEYCDAVLSSQLNNRQGPLPVADTRKIVKELLMAVDILHAKMIMHRDIKPDNILIDNQGKLKLADFGLAKKASFLQRRKSNAIVSLWYRAPEIILGSEDYFCGVDMWSVGCILAECMYRKPIFRCRTDDEVLTKVFVLLGCPTRETCPMYLNLKKFNLQKWQNYNQPQLRSVFGDQDPKAVDLLSKLLHIDPNKRILAREALQHPFFKDYE